MIALGIVLIGCDLLDLALTPKIALAERTLVPGWAGGALMIIAGLAYAAGRRSLRIAGLYVGMLLPLGFSGIFTWHAAKLWRAVGAGRETPLTAITMSALALVTLFFLAMLFHSRPREGIASRGYAVTRPVSRKAPADHAVGVHEVERPRRSEAG
jgi:hypothetical protein